MDSAVTYQFVPIAERPRPASGHEDHPWGRQSNAPLEWTNLEGAPMTPEQAWAALEDGKLTMVTKHLPDRCVLLIKPKVPEPPKPERPKWRRSPIR